LTIQRNWQHSVHKTKKNKTKTQHNQYVVDTTMRKQTRITYIRHVSSYNATILCWNRNGHHNITYTS